MPKSGIIKILGFDFSYSSSKRVVKIANDVHTTKARTRVILFSKKYWRILGRNELVDFLHIQYTRPIAKKFFLIELIQTSIQNFKQKTK